MWDFYRLLARTKETLKKLFDQLDNPYWNGTKYQIKICLKISKYEALLEALTFTLWRSHVAGQFAATLPQEVIKGMVQTVLKGKSIFWYLCRLLNTHPDAKPLPNHDNQAGRWAVAGRLCKFVTPNEITSIPFVDWVTANLPIDDPSEFNGRFIHPERLYLEPPTLKGFASIRSMLERDYPDHALHQLKEFDYQGFFIYTW